MPKIIPALRERIMDEARHILFDEQKSSITIREIAKRCDVALGTIYNYFPSKEVLVGSIIQQDWDEKLTVAVTNGQQAENALGAVCCVYKAICSVISTYLPLAQKRVINMNGSRPHEERYQELMQMLQEKLQLLLDEQKCPVEQSIVRQLTVLLFESANHENVPFEQLVPTIEKLLA